MKRLALILLAVGLLVVVGFLLFGPGGDRKPVLKVYNFSYYIGESTIADFEKEFGCRVIYDNYSSNEEMIGKIQTGTHYDVIFPTDYAVRIMRNADLLMELHHDRLPNMRNLDPTFLDQEFDPGNRFTVPYHWGTCGVGYDSTVVPKPESFDVLWDDEYKGRVSVLNEPRFTIGMVLRSLGYSASTTDESELQEAHDRLLELKANISAFSSDTYIKKLADGEIVLAYGYSAGVFQAAAENDRVQYAIPSGGTILWMDSLAIPKTAETPDLAHEFINFILRLEVIAPISNYVVCANANKEATELVAPEVRNNKGVYPDREIIERSEFLDDLGEKNDLYYDIWNKVKSK